MKYFSRFFGSLMIFSLTFLMACSSPQALPTTPSVPVVNASGLWNGLARVGNQSYTVRAQITDSSGALSGVLTLCSGACTDSSSFNGSRAGDNLTFNAVYPNGTATFAGGIAGNNITGGFTLTVNDPPGQAQFSLTMSR